MEGETSLSQKEDHKFGYKSTSPAPNLSTSSETWLQYWVNQQEELFCVLKKLGGIQKDYSQSF